MTELTTHLLGYLKPEQWADAVAYHGYPQEEVEELIEKQQEEFPSPTLMEDFRRKLGEKNDE